MEIETPVTLARLPRSPLEDGVVRTAQVYGVRAGQKRKRHEICTAVDGDSLSVYEVENGRIVASYPVPPTSTFCCKPSSVRIKNDKNLSGLRKTYCVMSQKGLQLQCFNDQSGSQNVPEVRQVSLPASVTKDSIVSLDLVTKTQDLAGQEIFLDVILVEDSGAVMWFPEDLSKQPRMSNLVAYAASNSIEILCSHALSLSEAKQSLLKHRADITNTVDEQKLFIVALYRTASDSKEDSRLANIGLWSVEQNKTSAAGLATSLILSHSLPMSQKWLERTSKHFSFGTNASTLCIESLQGFFTYGLVSQVPRLLADTVFEQQTQVYSTIQISSNFTAVALSNSVRIHNSDYHSIQANIDLQKSSKFSKRQSKLSRGPVKFVAYFAQLRRLIAIRNSNMVAFDLKSNSRDSKGSLLNIASSLADNLGRGAASFHSRDDAGKREITMSFGSNASSVAENPEWESVRRKLDELSTSGNAHGFEETLIKELQRKEQSRLGANAKGVDMLAPLDIVPNSQINYITTQIFRYAVPVNGQARETNALEVALKAPRILSWLIGQGLLQRRLIETSIASNMASTRLCKLPPGSIATALMKVDTSLRLLEQFVQLCAKCDRLELVAAIRLLLGRAVEQVRSSPDHNLLVANGADAMDIDQPGLPIGLQIATTNKHEEQAVAVRHGSDEAIILEATQHALVVALSSLGACKASTISSLLRSNFDQSEILAMIQFVRQQLFRSGYTGTRSRGNDQQFVQAVRHEPVSESGGELGLDAIIRLLSGSVDAIGPLGFFAQGDNVTFVENMIPDLKSELSRALEALDEAVALQGTLRETLRFADSMKRPGYEDKQRDISESTTIDQHKSGTIVTLYSEQAAEQGDVETREGLLPLSLRSEHVLPTKKRKGNGQIMQRSLRDMHSLQGRQIGRYAIDRLVL